MMRTDERLKEHYEVERALADRLRHAKRDDRTQLYSAVYDELFRRVPDHPQVTRKHDPREQEAAVDERLELLSRLLNDDSVFLEIGAGDGGLCDRVAQRVRKCYALDVSREIFDKPGHVNVEFVLSDGRTIGVPDGSITVAYSYQVMEHIHPDDAREQLTNIFRALAPGGGYLCVTPNKLNGPHDISRYFDAVATGFHLKEYTVTELRKLFREIGFRSVHAYVGFSHRYFRVPAGIVSALEALLGVLPRAVALRMASLPVVRNLLFISLLGVK